VSGELHHKGRHASIARYYPEGTIIRLGLSSWCGAGGWRLGALVFPDRLRVLLDATAAAATEVVSSTATPIQHAAIAAFEGGAPIEDYLRLARRVLRSVGRWCARRLRGVGVPCAQPVGGYTLLADFEPLRGALQARGVDSGPALCAALLREAGVAMMPGVAFGRPVDELTARLAYVDFDGGRALEAVGVIPVEQPLDEIFLERHCPRVVEGVRRVAGWVRGL